MAAHMYTQRCHQRGLIVELACMWSRARDIEHANLAKPANMRRATPADQGDHLMHSAMHACIYAEAGRAGKRSNLRTCAHREN
eukprot:365572-Chlamydomonas_euryale.AAC.7